MADIDAGGVNFQPIGTDYEHYFRGMFDGQGHRIYDLHIERPTEEYIGLFSCLMDKAIVKNLILECHHIWGLGTVGTLAGINSGTIMNCRATVIDLEARGKEDVGGLVGENYHGTILNCQLLNPPGGESEIESEGTYPDHVGGIAGINSGTIKWCRTEGTVDGDVGGSNGHEVGGIVGQNYQGIIQECYSTCRWIDGENEVGGIVGYSKGNIFDCYYSGGTVAADYSVGGIVGENEGAIERCLLVSASINGDYRGILVGKNYGSICCSFWPCPMSPPVYSGNLPVDSRCLTQEEMTQRAPFESASWDFENVWTIDEGVTHPQLRSVGDILNPPTGVLATDNLWQYVLIQWNSVPSAVCYLVYRSDSAIGTKVPLTNWQKELSFCDISAEAGTVYYYWVKAAATNTGGRESDFGSPAVGIRLEQLPTITFINYPFGSFAGEYMVSWFASTGATSYQLERSNDGGSSWTQVYSGLEISYSENVTDGVYRYRVKATNAGGSSDWTTGTWDCLVISIPGDFDESGQVEFTDFAIFASSWHSTPNQPNWNQKCDLSDPNNNVIDWSDLAIFAEHWLEGPDFNRAPVLATIGNKSINENSLLNFTISAIDADNDTITYSAHDLPSGATFSAQTFSWIPGYTQAGTYHVTFIASDGQDEDSESITITVNNVNRSPVLATIGSKSINENSLLSFTTSATDPGGTESDWSNVESSRQCSTPGDFEPDCNVAWADLAVLVDQCL